MHLRTTEAIADFVGVEYGRDMRMLVKHGTEKTFTKPRIPRSKNVTPGLMKKYTTELGIFHRDKKEFRDNKAKVFVIILGQCTHNVKSKLESELGYGTLEINDDVVGLLRQLKQMAFASGGIQHPFCTLKIVMRRLLAINQGPREPVTNYYRRFVSATKVIEDQWGKFYPDKLALSASDADKDITRDKYLSMIFLARADKVRFGTLIEDLNNSYLAGNDQYPAPLDGTLTLLSHYQGHRGSEHMDGDKNVSRKTSFAQRKPRPAPCQPDCVNSLAIIWLYVPSVSSWTHAVVDHHSRAGPCVLASVGVGCKVSLVMGSAVPASKFANSPSSSRVA
jgi:hypothetical protein